MISHYIKEKKWIRYVYFMYKTHFTKEKDYLREILDTFMSKKVICDKKQQRKLKRDVIFCRAYNDISYSQYFLFEFDKKSKLGRKEFVGDFEKKKLTYELHRYGDAWAIFKNKYDCYLKFKEFYCREIIKIENYSDKETFLDFVSRHERFIVKAIDKAEGNDIYIFNKNDASVEELFEDILQIGTCVIEELIEQDYRMGKFHPHSVNTIRFATFYSEGVFTEMFALLRMGCQGNHVDNAGAGGIVAAIDIETGFVKTIGYREDGTDYILHPDTNEKIVGFGIPRWSECRELVRKLAKICPEQKYVGWDLALTPSGWCMVEGNDRAMFTAIQMCEKKGIRPLVESTFGKVIGTVNKNK